MLDYGKIYLCKPQGILLGIPNGIKEETGSLKESMTDLWELTFEVDRYVDINGKRVESSYYSSLSEKMELLYEDNKQNRRVRFIIDKEPEITIVADKFQETKTVTAHSIEADLQTKFLRNFKINCGIEDSQEYLIYDEQGRQINVYQYDADTILPIDYIVLDCRLDDVCMKAKAYLKEKDFKLKEHVVQNTEVIKYLQSLIKKVPRLQKDVYYDTNGILKSHIYVYTNGEIISVDSKQSFLDGLDSLTAYYKKYKNKLSLFSLALENAKESGWTVDTSHLTDELANTKWNFEIGSQDIYSFLNNTLANYARIIILYDRNHKSVGAVSVNDVGNDTGVSISMKNLVNSVDITSTSENGIKTKMYPVGGDHLSIENVNFGSPYLINYDYFVDTLDDYGDYKYGNMGLCNRYHQWKQYCDKDTELYGMTRRQKYIEASKKYNQCMLDIDELTNRVPNDGCNINYASYKYDELILSLNAYNNSIQSIVDMYKAEYHADKVYDTSGSIPTDYPIDSNVIYQFDELPNGMIPINETYYWHDYYAFKTTILPKVYEALKIWCKTITQFDEALKKNIVYLSTNENGKLYLSQIAESNLVYLETGNAEYATENHLLNIVDSWMYEWELFGLDELKSKLKGWNEAAASLFREEFVEKDNNGGIIYEEKDYGGGYIVTYPKPKLDNANLANSERESLKELNNNFKYWLDYVSDDINRSVKNNMTGRTGGEKGMGIIRQCEKAIGELMSKIKKLQAEQQIYSGLRKTLQSECSYETNTILTSSDRAILNSLESSCDYSNENIAVTSLDDVVSAVDIQERLYQDAYEKLYENSIPQYSFNSTNENLFSIAEFTPMINQCIVGNYIRVGINLFQDMYVKLRLISIIKNPFIDDMELSMEFSSMTKSLNGFSDLTFLLDDMVNSSSINNSSSSSNGGNYGDNKYNLQFSENLLNALLTNDAIKTATSDAVLNSIKSDNGVFVKLLATNGIFDSLKVGDIGISGDCLITGQIKSNNYSSKSGSLLNLDDGNFSFGGGSLTYHENKLNITGDIQGSNFIGGTIQSSNYDSDKKLGSIFDLNNGTFCFADGKLNYDGTDLKLSGKLDGVTGQFKSGNIGSFILDENEISSGTEISAGMGVAGKRVAFWAGAEKNHYDNAPFIVTHEGKLKTTNIEVTGGQISIPYLDESFYEDSYGSSDINAKGIALNYTNSNSITKKKTKRISTYSPGYFSMARCECGLNEIFSEDYYDDFITSFRFDSADAKETISRKYFNEEIHTAVLNDEEISFMVEVSSEENLLASFGNNGIYNQKVYKDTVSSGSPVYIDSDGNFHRYVSSSKRYKHSFNTTLSHCLDPHALYDINVISYQYNSEYLPKSDQRSNKDFIGFLAEDIYEKYPIACDLNKDGKPEMWNIYILFPALVKLVQEQHEELENLKKTIKPTI